MVEPDRACRRCFAERFGWLGVLPFFIVLACSARPAELPSKADPGNEAPPQATSEPAGKEPGVSVKACEPLSLTTLSYDEQVALKKESYAQSLRYGDYELVQGDLDANLGITSTFIDHKQKSARAVGNPGARWVFENSWEEQAVWLLNCEGTLQAHDPATLQELWRLDIGALAQVRALSTTPGLMGLKFAARDSCWFWVTRAKEGTIVWRSETFSSSDTCMTARLDLQGSAGFLIYGEEASPSQAPLGHFHEIFVNLLTGERWFEETFLWNRYEVRPSFFTTDLLVRLREPTDKPSTPGAKTLTAHSLKNGQRLWSRPVCTHARECELQLDTFEGSLVVLHGDARGADLEVWDSTTGTPLWSRSIPATDLQAVHKAGSRWVFAAAPPCAAHECPPPSAYRVVDMTKGALLHETKVEALADFSAGSNSAAINGERLAVFLPHAGTTSMEQRAALYTLGEKQPLWTTPPSACLLGTEHRVLLEEDKIHVCNCDNVLRSYDLKTKRQLLRVGLRYCGALTLENGALHYDGAELAAQPWVNAQRTVQIHGEVCVDGEPNEYSGFLQVGDRRIRAPLGPFTVQSTLPGYITVQAVPSHTDLEWDSSVVGPLETDVEIGSACVGHFHP